MVENFKKIIELDAGLSDDTPWSVPEADEVEGEDALEGDVEPELVVPHRPAKPVKPKKR